MLRWNGYRRIWDQNLSSTNPHRNLDPPKSETWSSHSNHIESTSKVGWIISSLLQGKILNSEGKICISIDRTWNAGHLHFEMRIADESGSAHIILNTSTHQLKLRDTERPLWSHRINFKCWMNRYLIVGLVPEPKDIKLRSEGFYQHRLKFEHETLITCILRLQL